MSNGLSNVFLTPGRNKNIFFKEKDAESAEKKYKTFCGIFSSIGSCKTSMYSRTWMDLGSEATRKLDPDLLDVPEMKTAPKHTIAYIA